MQRPGAGAAHQEGVAKLRLAGLRVGEVAERAVERLDAGRGAGVDHLGERVVPEILLERGARRRRSASASASTLYSGWPPPTRVVFMAREAARSAGPRLMPCMRGEAVAIAATLSTPSAVSRMAWMRIGFLTACLRFELRQQLVEIMDVPWAFDLRQHDDVELVADRADDLDDVVEHPGRIERVDARPQAGRAEVVRLRHGDEARARRLLGVGRDGVFEIAEHDVDLARSAPAPWRAASRCAAARNGSCARA